MNLILNYDNPRFFIRRIKLNLCYLLTSPPHKATDCAGIWLHVQHTFQHMHLKKDKVDMKRINIIRNGANYGIF